MTYLDIQSQASCEFLLDSIISSEFCLSDTLCHLLSFEKHSQCRKILGAKYGSNYQLSDHSQRYSVQRGVLYDVLEIPNGTTFRGFRQRFDFVDQIKSQSGRMRFHCSWCRPNQNTMTTTTTATTATKTTTTAIAGLTTAITARTTTTTATPSRRISRVRCCSSVKHRFYRILLLSALVCYENLA